MKVKVDFAKNRLYLKMSGEMSKKDLEKLYTDVRFSVADLQPGFTVIADYSESSLIKLSGISTYRRLMNYLIKSSVGEVVRVVEDKSILSKQVKNLSSRICSYKAIYSNKLTEADAILDASMKRKGLRFHFSSLHSAEFIANDIHDTGQLLNLSTSGCAISCTSECPPFGEDIRVKLAFACQNNSLHEFTIKGRVVRAKINEFAVEFQDFEEEQKEKLLNCLFHEIEHEI